MIEEPVGQGEGQENPYLERFYKDQKRWAFPMQIFLLHKRYAMQQLASYEATGVGGYKGAILDRSIAGDRVFAKLHVDAGNIDPLDFATYEMAYDTMARTLLPPTMMIYLDVQPETAFARMKKRNRGVEEGVPLDYLQKLHKGYQELLREAKRGLTPWAHAVTVCHIPWDPDTLDNAGWDTVTKTILGACQSG